MIEGLKPKESRWKNAKYDTCECGHFNFKHMIGFWWYGRCGICVCKKFKKIGKYSRNELKDTGVKQH